MRYSDTQLQRRSGIRAGLVLFLAALFVWSNAAWAAACYGLEVHWLHSAMDQVGVHSKKASAHHAGADCSGQPAGNARGVPRLTGDDDRSSPESMDLLSVELGARLRADRVGRAAQIFDAANATPPLYLLYQKLLLAPPA